LTNEAFFPYRKYHDTLNSFGPQLRCAQGNKIGISSARMNGDERRWEDERKMKPERQGQTGDLPGEGPREKNRAANQRLKLINPIMVI
jgi:hypothetical protein